MNENNFNEVAPRPTLEELDNFSGREIEGIESKPEKFLPLKEGEDFRVVKTNNRVQSDRALQDFIVFISPSAGTETKIVEAPHWRAINDNDVHSSVDVVDEGGGSSSRDYFYGVSTKGIGYLKPTVKDLNIEDYDSWAVADKDGVNDRGYKVLGLISQEEAERGELIEKSNRLVGLGLRTEVYWGVVELKQLPFRGKKRTVDELRDRGVISPRKTYKPYEVVRLFKMNNRIAEASESDERREDLFRRAFDVFNREIRDKNLPLAEVSIGDPEKELIFFGEFFRRMGANMATLLNIGHDHGYLHSANVTLAAEIGDVGTISPWTEEKDEHKKMLYAGVRRGHLKDMRDMCYGLRMLLKAAKRAGLHYGHRSDMEQSFFSGFDQVFDSAKVGAQETNATNAKLWMSKIFNHVIIEGNRLAPLVSGEVEDWDISV